MWKFKILLKLIFIKLFKNKTTLFPDPLYIKTLYFLCFWKWPDLENPKTYNEFICNLKLQEESFNYYKYTDKYDVRSYVEDKVGSKYLNDCYGVYNSFSDISFDTLPKKFVIKATHGSGYNKVVADKQKMNYKKLKEFFDKTLKENYYYYGREKNYYNIKPRITIEKFLETLNDNLFEYKIFCFNGKPRFIQLNKETTKGRYANIYDTNWQKFNLIHGYQNFENNTIPDNLNELLKVASTLSQKFRFVRVDLYNIDGKIIFSELTFHSGGGCVFFKPKKYDKEFAQFFTEQKSK